MNARKPKTAKRAIAQCGKLLFELELFCRAPPPVADAALCDEDAVEESADLLNAAAASEADAAEADATDEADCKLKMESGKFVCVAVNVDCGGWLSEFVPFATNRK